MNRKSLTANLGTIYNSPDEDKVSNRLSIEENGEASLNSEESPQGSRLTPWEEEVNFYQF